MILPFVLRDDNLARSSNILAPFRALHPVLDKVTSAPDMNTVSHAADAGLAVAPRRLVIRGTMFSDFFPELLTGVWERWVAFTETNEDVRSSAVLWDTTHPGKLSEVPHGATAVQIGRAHV